MMGMVKPDRVRSWPQGSESPSHESSDGETCCRSKFKNSIYEDALVYQVDRIGIIWVSLGSANKNGNKSTIILIVMTIAIITNEGICLLHPE